MNKPPLFLFLVWQYGDRGVDFRFNGRACAWGV
nr:MAG TPA: hypothetical protein [Caudoviricetes sp.]